MTSSARRYIAVETLISIVINTALSAGFCWLTFGARDVIALPGAQGYGVDFLPQAFMITLMSVIVPTLLTRKRRATGAVTRLEGRGVRPVRLAWRAPIAAVLVSVLLGGGAWLLAGGLLPARIGFSALLAIKLIFGALVAALVTPLGLIAALRDAPRVPSA